MPSHMQLRKRVRADPARVLSDTGGKAEVSAAAGMDCEVRLFRPTTATLRDLVASGLFRVFATITE